MMLFKYHRGLTVWQHLLTCRIFFFIKLTVKHKGNDISIKFISGFVCDFVRDSSVGSVAHLRRVPIPFSSTCIPNLSASCLGSTEVFWFCPQFRLIKFPSPTSCPPFIWPDRLLYSYGFVDVLFGLVLNCLSATMTSAESVYFCNLLNWGNKGMQLLFQIFSWFSWLLMVL